MFSEVTRQRWTRNLRAGAVPHQQSLTQGAMRTLSTDSIGMVVARVLVMDACPDHSWAAGLHAILSGDARIRFELQRIAGLSETEIRSDARPPRHRGAAR